MPCPTPHLQKISSKCYYFRIRIPKDLKTYFGSRNELKRSLRTVSLAQARRLARVWEFRMEMLFTTLRLSATMLSRDEVKLLAEKYLHSVLGDYEDFRALYRPTNESGLATELRVLEERLTVTRNALTFGEGYPRRAQHEDFIKENCLELLGDESSLDRHSLERELLKQDLEICRVEIERAKGNYANGYDDRIQVQSVPSLPQPSLAVEVESKPKPRLSDLWDAYQKDKTAMRQWRSSSRKKYEGFYRTILDITGDRELIEFESPAVTTDLIENLQKYPCGKNQITSQYRGKPFDPEWCKQPGFRPLSVGLINEILVQLSAWFDFALHNPKQWGISFNPYSKKQLPVPENDRKPKAAYTTEEIQKLVNGLNEQSPTEQPERFWIPLLGLFTGARIDELCQLRVEDIEEYDGLAIINIRHKPELQQSTKSGKSRVCPVHPTLLELGLIHFAQKQRNAGYVRLFPNLKYINEKWSHKYGQWYNERFEPKYISDAKDKSFHSTRHSLISWFKRTQEMTLHNLSVLKSMVGHMDKTDRALLGFDLDKDMTWGRYGGEHSPQVQFELLKRLDYGVDFLVLQAKLS